MTGLSPVCSDEIAALAISRWKGLIQEMPSAWGTFERKSTPIDLLGT